MEPSWEPGRIQQNDVIQLLRVLNTSFIPKYRSKKTSAVIGVTHRCTCAVENLFRRQMVINGIPVAKSSIIRRRCLRFALLNAGALVTMLSGLSEVNKPDVPRCSQQLAPPGMEELAVALYGGVFISCVNLWRHFHLMGSTILTLWGHGQSKSLFLQPRHSHVMRKPTGYGKKKKKRWKKQS